MKSDYSVEKIKEIKTVYKQLTEELGREPEVEEIAAQIGSDDIQEIRDLLNYDVEELEENDQQNDFQFKFKLTIKNYELEKARLKLKLEQKDIATELGINDATYCAIECCRNFPSIERQNKICKIVKESKEKIFPKWLEMFSTKWKKNQNKSVIVPAKKLSLDCEEIKQIESGDYEEMIRTADNSLANSLINEAIGYLTPREQKIIDMRYGLSDNIPHTLEEVSKEFGVNRERIRQIEAKSFEKIKACGKLDKFN